MHITRHLSLDGDQLVDLADPARGMSKQAMGALVDSAEAWGWCRRPTRTMRAARRALHRRQGWRGWRPSQRRGPGRSRTSRAEVGADVAAVARPLA